VVGNRCLFNAHKIVGGVQEDLCTIAYPVNTSGVASSGLIYPANNPSRSEVPLPSAIATAVNSALVNLAGTDIRPEDAEFAEARATTGCGTAIVDPTTGNPTQYLGLGYDTTVNNNIDSFFSGSLFHVVDFTLPTTYSVTPIGATPVVVAVTGSSTGLGPIFNITSANLAQFLDGRNSWSGQANGTGASGEPVTVLVREPISGTYNTMEYNVPNRTTADASGFPFKTSQDVGVNQPIAQRDCPSVGVGLNPMNIPTASGAHRRRAIGTGQELTEVLNTATNGTDILGYSFWSTANFNAFATASASHYLTVDSIDPLFTTSPTGNKLPTAGTTELASVNLAHVIDGTYPIWSLIRFVTIDSTSTANAQTLATATQHFVSFGTSSSRPDFVNATSLSVVRSHFIPPAGSIQPSAPANGHVGLTTSFCSTPEAGGDVGGVVLSLAAESSFCGTSGNHAGHTAERR